MYSLSKYERETVILFNESETEATCYTCSLPLIRKMDKLCGEHPDTFKVVSQDDYSKTYTMPKNLVTIRAPRIFTEEKLLQMREKGKLLSQRIG